MIVVRGVNVFPEAIASILAERPDWFSREFEIVVETPAPIDRIGLRVELNRGIRDTAGPWTEYLPMKLKVGLNVSPRLEFLLFGGLPRTEGKSRRLRYAVGAEKR
jgi:phenylacetate-coenzyme A ligase PaaK-like adenylate-forming protein